MTGQSNNPGPSSPPNKIFWRAFWITLGILFAVVFTLTYMAKKNAETTRILAQARDVTVTGRIVGRVLDEGFPATQAMIDPLIDAVFAPAYENIPAFADWHFSVLGEYTQLTLAATGKLEAAMNARLFPGLDQRLQVALGKLDENLREEYSQAISDSISKEAGTMPARKQEIYRSALVLSLDGNINNFAAQLATRGIGAVVGAGGGAIVATIIIKTVAKKLITSLVAKTVVKAGAKASGLTGGAAAGASVGALGGPLGAAIGGVVGAVGGWLLVDAAVVTADEWINRDKYEAELRALIDEQKKLVKQNIRDTIYTLTKPVMSGDGNSTPSDLMQNSN